jgi:protein-L-isoaspartate(D-aspartate) O-methyltransferase
MTTTVDEAFAQVDRRDFLPVDQRQFARLDRPLPIGLGQTNSQPSTVARMLELLDVRPGQRVLDVGAGSGWTTALLGRLVGPGGQVVGVELEPDLARWGGENLARQQMPWTSLQTADPDVLGCPEHAPYDRVLVSAEARSLPQPLVDQLTPEGRMVVPVKGRMLVVARRPDGAVDVTRHGRYSFVPLR